MDGEARYCFKKFYCACFDIFIHLYYLFKIEILFERVIIEEYMNGDLIASLLNSVRFLFICLLLLFFKLIHFERAERKEEI